ncbi:hypothetical protein [Methylobacterium nonmethylotrophicum]|uniref:hypothetical protein n=1 Tax=Methylobacterium nonmethylotrophicum TaxID=1141884 RepID=UPI0014367C60|nr:hypothetical protein [Methylobacterium nonmethylotrophicum]
MQAVLGPLVAPARSLFDRIEEADRDKRLQGTPHARFRQSKVAMIGEAAPIDGERRHQPARHRPEARQEDSQGERGLSIAERCQ